MRHHAFAAAMGVLTAAVLAPCSPSHAASLDPTGYWYKPDAMTDPAAGDVVDQRGCGGECLEARPVPIDKKTRVPPPARRPGANAVRVSRLSRSRP